MPNFDPRRATLQYAADAERAATVAVEEGDGSRRDWAVAQATQAVACGLVYVGDQIARQTSVIAALASDVDAEELAEALNAKLGSRG